MPPSIPIASAPTSRTGPPISGGMPVPTAASVTIPLPYLVTGIGAAALFGVLLPWVAPLAMLAPDFPHVLALVHVATLGWLTMVVLGASLQLVPVMTVSELRAARFVRWQYPVFVAGVTLLVIGFWWFVLPLLILGGSLIILAVCHHVVVLSSTILRTTTRTLSTRFILMALGYLLLVVGLGLTMALNFQFDFLGTTGDRVLLTHLTLGLVGWLTNMLIGVSYTLIRMFALVHGHSDHRGRWIFALVQGAIVGMALGSLLGWQWLQLAGGVVLSGTIGLFAWDVATMFRMRRRRPIDMTMRHSIASVAYLVVLTPLALVALWRGDHTAGHAAAIVLAVLVGWLGQSTVGYLYKIIPFLVWQTRFSPLLGKQKVPLMRDMIKQRWAEVSWWLINSGLPVTCLALACGWQLPMQLAAYVMGTGLVLAAGNILRAAFLRPHPSIKA